MLSAQLSQLKDLLKIHWQHSEFRFGQEQAIRSVLEGKNTVVVMPTGGGKSLIYQLPALILDGVTIVVSPLIALMKDQVDQLEHIGVPATFINSSLSPIETNQRITAIQNNTYKLVYIAPERFYSQEFLTLLENIKVSLFAIDEAHCISEWGHDFRPSYLKLRGAIAHAGNPPVLAVTATATPEVKADIIKQLQLQNPEVVVTGFNRPNLKFGVIRASDAQKFLEILEIVQQVNGSGIIYAGTRQKVESLLEYLLNNGISATGYHAGMEAEDRKAVQNDFMNSRVRVIIATNAFGLGIDKADIRFVIHADMPGTVEAYYQEAGRAGRDGKESYCILCYSPADRYLREFFISGDNPPPTVITEVYENLLSYESDTVLATYAELMEGISEKAPDMAVGTALRILEREGYVRRNREKTGRAFLKFLRDAQHIKNRLGGGAKIQHQTFDGLCRHFGDALQTGVDFVPDEIAGIAGVKREAVTRLLKKLQDEGLVEYRPPFRGTEINMLKRVRPQELEIDFTALKEKHKRELSKLDLMESYVYHDGCRRKYILDYFQDTAAKPCGICDNCAMGNSVRVNPDDIQFETKLTQLETYELYEQGLSINEMAQARNLKPGAIVQHLCFLMAHGKNIDVAKFVDLKKQKLIQKAAQQTGTDTLTPIKEMLGEKANWDEIHLTLSYFKK
jgi:ATP-dependent DNA helicase RecQ